MMSAQLARRVETHAELPKIKKECLRSFLEKRFPNESLDLIVETAVLSIPSESEVILIRHETKNICIVVD